ncbi:MAG TPA: type II toxin-antitoxin system VapC family toxin [Gemmataceae bacterium]|nr:type II toxin-antitoxin system VapC family toxin [Gemmataceae bacterium]
MRYVLDASVAVKWALPEVDSDKAILLRDEFSRGLHELLSPDIFPIEVAHSLTRAERQKRISPADGALALADLLKNLPDLHPSIPLLGRAYTISSAVRIGVYDCLYLALAEREKCELVTGDDKLVKNLQKTFPFITPLSALPGTAPPTTGS